MQHYKHKYVRAKGNLFHVKEEHWDRDAVQQENAFLYNKRQYAKTTGTRRHTYFRKSKPNKTTKKYKTSKAKRK